MVADEVVVETRRAGDERGLALVVRRQGLLHHRPAGARGRARARHPRHPPSQRRQPTSFPTPIASSAWCASIPAPSPCRSTSSTRPGGGAAPHRRRRGDLGQGEVRRHARGIRRILPRPVGPVRRAGADPALARRRAARIYGARLHPRLAAVRSVRSDRARAATSFTCGACSSPRMPTFFPAGCASCGWSSTAPTCRSTSRAR